MGPWLFRKILVVHDGGEPASRAFEKALALAALTNAQLHLLLTGGGILHGATTKAEVDDYKCRAEDRFREISEELIVQAAAQDVDLCVHVHCGYEIPTVIDFLKKHKCDLLVLSSVSHSSIFKKLLFNQGSTAQSLIRLSPCTVLVVK